MARLLVRLVPEETNVPFIQWRSIAAILSAVLIVVSLGAFFTRGLNFGIDFRGGVLVQAGNPTATDVEDLITRLNRDSLDIGQVTVDAATPGVLALTMPADRVDLSPRLVSELESTFACTEVAADADDPARIALTLPPALPSLDVIRNTVQALNLGDVQVQEFGGPDMVLVTVEATEADIDAASLQIRTAMLDLAPMCILRDEGVGAKVSGELVRAGAIAVLVALVLMLGYIWFVFEEWQFSVGAVLALLHDVILTIGMFAVTQIEFNLSIIAAILTIVGYSMNDTVVVYDRVREKMRKYKKMELPDLLNFAINKTLSRTVVTSVTTLLALLALFFLGGEVLRGFAFAMIWGVIVGTYSSIFVAAPVLLLTGVRRIGERDEAAADPSDVT